jgi:predicted nucleic acid-binding protein
VIILDTNVVSALMTDEPDATVARWLDRQPRESIWTTTVTIFELRVGIELLPVSRKRQRIEEQFSRFVHEDIQDRVLTLDARAAHEAAILSARRRLRGMPIETRDTMIAGIVISRRAEFATRNVRHFADLDAVIDPWDT